MVTVTQKVVEHTHASDGVELARLAEEQAALRPVATLLAQGAEPSRLFAVVAERVARVLHVPLASVVRFEDDDTVVQRASYPALEPDLRDALTVVRPIVDC